VLVTGGSGYIGSHTVLELLRLGHYVVVVDNCSNSNCRSLNRVCQILFGTEDHENLVFCQGDIRDYVFLCAVFENYGTFDSVVHFAALKSVGDSVLNPLDYYDNNLCGTIELLKVMKKFDVYSFIFSSSATVYGSPTIEEVPLKESKETSSAACPYGTTKLMIEQVLKDLSVSSNLWRIIMLRYFNPIGADESGMIGEDSGTVITNLMPFITQVAIGNRPHLSIFGSDYPTKDGTAIRDYIHVTDLAKGHISAISKSLDSTGCFIYNLGTGLGYSVLEIISTFKEATGIDIPYVLVDRRPGDVIITVADNTLAKTEMGWTPELDLKRMCTDQWRWQQNNPNGYKTD